MSRIIDITGQRFGRLTVVRFDRMVVGRSYWLFKCDCGNVKSIRRDQFISGKTKSCGCLRKEITKQRFTKHGCINTPIYNSWQSMKNRCLNKNHKRYQDYGGRGITLCKRWLVFENFYEDMGERPKGLTIDRIDNSQGYFKENCQWLSAKNQNRNKRNNVFYTYNGKTKCLVKWSELLQINSKTLFSRIKLYKWSIQKAFETPVR